LRARVETVYENRVKRHVVGGPDIIGGQIYRVKHEPRLTVVIGSMRRQTGRIVVGCYWPVRYSNKS